jgi:hypothetical protein
LKGCISDSLYFYDAYVKDKIGEDEMLKLWLSHSRNDELEERNELVNMTVSLMKKVIYEKDLKDVKPMAMQNYVLWTVLVYFKEVLGNTLNKIINFILEHTKIVANEEKIKMMNLIVIYSYALEHVNDMKIRKHLKCLQDEAMKK